VGTNLRGPPERTINNFHDHPLYIQALVQRIGSVLRQFPDSSRIHLVFSAHGLPMSLVEKGDPYPKQIEETVRLAVSLVQRRIPAGPGRICCATRAVWPREVAATAAYGTIEPAGPRRRERDAVVPISFVTEHMKRSTKINIEAREEAKKLGVETFRMMPRWAIRPLFIAALKELVLHAVGVDAGERPGRAAFPR